jgi:hypothetical protein
MAHRRGKAGIGWMSCLRRIVGLRVGDVSMVTFSARVFVFFARVDEALMANEEVATRESLATEIADEGLLLGVGADVSLQMFLYTRVKIGVVKQMPRAPE